LTDQTIYVSATPAEFEIQNSVVGNKRYFPHKRQRIGEEELVPFVLPGGKRRTPNAQRPTSNSEARISNQQINPVQGE
jgi:excinuclease ABC subunit B